MGAKFCDEGGGGRGEVGGGAAAIHAGIARVKGSKANVGGKRHWYGEGDMSISLEKRTVT